MHKRYVTLHYFNCCTLLGLKEPSVGYRMIRCHLSVTVSLLHDRVLPARRVSDSSRAWPCHFGQWHEDSVLTIDDNNRGLFVTFVGMYLESGAFFGNSIEASYLNGME